MSKSNKGGNSNWDSIPNIQTVYNDLYKHQLLSGEPIIATVSDKVDGSNSYIDIVADEHDIFKVFGIYGKDSVIWHEEEPMNIENIKNIKYGGIVEYNMDNINVLIFQLAVGVANKLGVKRLRVYGEVYKVNIESWHPYGYSIDDSVDKTMLTIETYELFMEVLIEMGTNLPRFNSFEMMHEYLKIQTESVIIPPPILYHGDIIHGCLYLAPSFLNIPEEYRLQKEGVVAVFSRKVGEKLMAVKLKTPAFSESSGIIKIVEYNIPYYHEFLIFLNKLKSPDDDTDLEFLHNYSNKDELLLLSEKFVIKNRIITKTIPLIKKAIFHELSKFTNFDIELQLKYIIFCQNNKKSQLLKIIPIDKIEIMDNLIISTIGELKDHYDKNDTTIQMNDVDIFEYVYELLKEIFISIKDKSRIKK